MQEKDREPLYILCGELLQILPFMAMPNNVRWKSLSIYDTMSASEKSMPVCSGKENKMKSVEFQIRKLEGIYG